MENKDKIEIPFGAKDSELYECEYTIPEGYEAEIKDGKVINIKKESEDEKIRKEIIDFVKSRGGFKGDWIAWLEKQGDKDKLIKELGEYKVKYTQEVLQGEQKSNPCENCSIATNNCQKFPCTIRDGEQKPAEWSEEDEDNFKHLIDEIVCLGNSRNSANRLYYDKLIKFLHELKNRAQPREEWRDKDERMLDRLIAYFEKRVAFTDGDNPRYANWLKSLKDRVQPQPKQEWSEEDKKLIDDTCHLINTLASGYGEKVTEPITLSGTQMIASIKDRLRALVDNRPQNHWKPSEREK